MTAPRETPTTTVEEVLPRLTPTQRDELRHVYRTIPDSIHDYDREPECWLRFVSRRSTIEALHRLGLVEDGIYTDYPVGGYRARLSERGVQVRRELRSPMERAIETLSICRDEDCPECGWPETYAEGTLATGPSSSYTLTSPTAIGCRKCGWRKEITR